MSIKQKDSIDWKKVAQAIAEHINLTQNSYPPSIAHHLSIHYNEEYTKILNFCEFTASIYPILSAGAHKYRFYLSEASTQTGLIMKDMYTKENAETFSEIF